MNLKYFFFALFLYLHYQINQCNSEKITYFSTERPMVNWYDPRCFKNFTLKSRRLSRKDPRYYVELYFQPFIPLDNNIKLSFYFYQFLTNRYKPSFIEMHFRFCDMINTDAFFGQPIQNAFGDRRCPCPPGEYDLKNLSIPHVPRGFPFTKGRIYCNVSLTTGSVTKLIGYGSIDMEVKVAVIRTH